jgi:hypothetical protein
VELQEVRVQVGLVVVVVHQEVLGLVEQVVHQEVQVQVELREVQEQVVVVVHQEVLDLVLLIIMRPTQTQQPKLYQGQTRQVLYILIQ